MYADEASSSILLLLSSSLQFLRSHRMNRRDKSELFLTPLILFSVVQCFSICLSVILSVCLLLLSLSVSLSLSLSLTVSLCVSHCPSLSVSLCLTLSFSPPPLSLSLSLFHSDSIRPFPFSSARPIKPESGRKLIVHFLLLAMVKVEFELMNIFRADVARGCFHILKVSSRNASLFNDVIPFP